MGLEIGPNRTIAPTAEDRLLCLILDGKCLEYEKDRPDRDHARVRWSVYGAPETNELYVMLRFGETRIVEIVASPVADPPMAQRTGFTHRKDLEAALELADKMLLKYSAVLASQRAA